MSCPLCKAADVAEDASSCSACGSDLSAFKHLKVIVKNRSKMIMTNLTLGGILLFALVGLGFTYMRAETAPPKPEPAPVVDNTEMEQRLAKKDAQIAKLTAELDELTATLNSAEDDTEDSDYKGKFTVHIVQKGESMWGISKTYHGHGFKHEDIAGHNELDNSHSINVGDTLIIRHD
jgi:LysM repeat protein